MKFRYDYEKNAKLLLERGIGFEEIIREIADGNLIRITDHHNKEKYPSQKLMHVKVLNKIYIVPYVLEQDSAFLKTLYPSAKATKKYFGEVSSE